MVTIITEKLRNQTLDEVVQFAPISKTRRSWEITATGINPVKDKHLPSGDNTYHSSVITPLNTADAARTNLPATTTSVRHQVSTPQSCDTATHLPAINTHQPDRFTRNPQQHAMQTSDSASSSAKDNANFSAFFPSIFTGASSPQDPPKKRHCRSLSEEISSNQWQPQASSIWKPVALRGYHSSSKLIKSRNSPLHLHKPRLRSASPSNLAANSNNPFNSHMPRSHSPALSQVSGDLFSTPPESPVPRPASASSGFYDSSASQTSLASLNVSWTEGFFPTQPVFSPHPPPRSRSVSGGSAFLPQRTDFKWERSLSVEEPIFRQSKFTVQKGASGDAGVCDMSAQSMPVINLHNTVPSSPRRSRVPRCRSQPCVLSEVKVGMKRRRAEERPSINFKKMSETAYPQCVPNNRPKSVTFAQDIQEILHTETSLYPDTHYHVLDPIASSPLDSAQGLLAPPANPRASLCDVVPSGGSQEEVQWDSGCSDINDPPDLISLGESVSENSFNEGLGGSTADVDDDQQFQLDMTEEIDLDQIEKD